MDRAVRNLTQLGVPLVEALAGASTVPARLLGQPELGTLRPGHPADIVVLDASHQVQRTVVGGRQH
jgi:N-acetylglucosamine-6-phosphate deacetylase